MLERLVLFVCGALAAASVASPGSAVPQRTVPCGEVIDQTSFPYQASFEPDNPNVTILQVVRNPSWLIPYVACGMMTLGLI